MKRKLIALLCAAAMIASVAACGSSKPETAAPASEPAAEEAVEAEAPAEEAEAPAEEEAPAVIDTSDTKIEVFQVSNWGGEKPPEGEDPVEQYIESFAGGDWSMTLPTEGETELITRFASGSAPDLIVFDNATQMNMLYEQGVLVEDWNVFAEKIPSVLENMGSEQRAFFTKDGKLTGLGTMPGDQKWAFLIRQDWLNNLGLDMPTTPEELLDVMRAFTFDDPDGNGKDDTYGFTAAGGGSTNELAHLILLFDNPSYYVTDGNTVSHPIVDGSWQKYLDMARTIVSEGLINPDFYTLGWDDRKPDLYKGTYGICWYPPAALLNETSQQLEDKEDYTMADAWAVMDMCGGKAQPLMVMGQSLLSVSAEAAADEAKMEVICNFIEKTSGFTEYYCGVRMYAGLSEYCAATINSPTSVYQYYDASHEEDPFFAVKNAYGAISNWGRIVNCNGGAVITGNTPEPNYWVERSIELNAAVDANEAWPSAYMLYAEDPTLSANVDAMTSEFEISYIMGETDDYEGFVLDWLSAGGQELLDGAEEAFRSFGFIK